MALKWLLGASKCRLFNVLSMRFMDFQWIFLAFLHPNDPQAPPRRSRWIDPPYARGSWLFRAVWRGLDQEDFVEEVLRLGKELKVPVVTVLLVPGAVVMPWSQDASGILMMFPSGQSFHIKTFMSCCEVRPLAWPLRTCCPHLRTSSSRPLC